MSDARAGWQIGHLKTPKPPDVYAIAADYRIRDRIQGDEQGPAAVFARDVRCEARERPPTEGRSTTLCRRSALGAVKVSYLNGSRRSRTGRRISNP